MVLLSLVCFTGAFLLLCYGSWRDYQQLRIPYVTILGVGILGLMFLYAEGRSLFESAVGSIFTGVILYSVAKLLELRRGRPVLGYGDLQLFMSCVLWVELSQLPMFFMVAGIVGVCLAFFWRRHSYFPLAPAIASAWIVAVML